MKHCLTWPEKGMEDYSDAPDSEVAVRDSGISIMFSVDDWPVSNRKTRVQLPSPDPPGGGQNHSEFS